MVYIFILFLDSSVPSKLPVSIGSVANNLELQLQAHYSSEVRFYHIFTRYYLYRVLQEVSDQLCLPHPTPSNMEASLYLEGQESKSIGARGSIHCSPRLGRVPVVWWIRKQRMHWHLDNCLV
jgi:hypothetical protein